MDKLLAASLIFAFASSSCAEAATSVDTGINASPIKYSEFATPADSFAGSAGFDANYEDHTYPPLVTTELEWSGVRHLRDATSPSQLLEGIFADLGRHGIGHSLGVDRGFAASTVIGYLKAFEPYVEFAEPSNEADNVKDPNWAQMRADQVRLYQTIRSNPKYNNVIVLGPSFANPQLHAPLVGPLDTYENAGQIHNDTCDWEPSTTLFGSGIAANIVKIRATTVYKPIWTTETGYTDDFKRGCSLPDQNIARYIPRELALRYMFGMPRTYFTFLVDRPSDVVFGAEGLLHPSGQPKPQFLTLGNLVRLTADPGPAIGGRNVSFEVIGATPDVNHLMLARRDGSYDLLIWREMPSWDHMKRAQIAVPSESIEIQLPAGRTHAAIAQVNSAYGDTVSPLYVHGGRTASFAIDDKITTLHLSY